MGLENNFDKQTETPKPNVEGRIGRELAKLEALNALEPSGDIYYDFNTLLEISGKETLYKRVDESVHPDVVLASLAGLQTTWEKILESDLENENNSSKSEKSPEYQEAIRLTKFTVPEKLIATTGELVNFYLKNPMTVEEKH